MRIAPLLVCLMTVATATPWLAGGAQAHPVDVIMEAEGFDARPAGSALSDGAASGGVAWGFTSAGNISTAWNGDHAGTYTITVWARGTANAGFAAPEMTVFDDGRAIGHSRVGPTYARYSVNETVAQASHRLTVALTDVDAGSGQTLVVDKAEVFLALVSSSGDPLPQWFEGESFPSRSGSGALVASDGASGGAAWALSGNASIKQTFATTGGLQYYRVWISARADASGGDVGKLVLRVNGAIVHSWYRVSPEWAAYEDTVALYGGNHTISITFTNDENAAAPSRTVDVDAARVSKTAPVRPLGASVRYEAETFPTRLGSGTVQRDPTASAGSRWKQAGNGTIMMSYAPGTAGKVTFSIIAKGEPALGTWPELKLRIDNVTRVRWNASTWLYKSYNYSTTLTASAHVIEIASYTAYRSSTQNRTLYVDALDITSEGDPFVLPPPQPGASDWAFLGRDASNGRVNLNEATLTRANVGALAPVWNFHTPRAVTGSPVLVDGHVYLGDWGGTVYRVNATTGAQEWNRSLGHGFLASTPLVAEGRVFIGTGNGELAALDAANGSVLWVLPLDSFNATRAYGAPMYSGGKIYIGVSSDQESNFYTATPDFRGSVLRVDAATGHIDWRFYTVPPGFTGAATWSAPALDVGTGTLYYDTGNAYTTPAHERTNSIVALNATTGTFLWSHQAIANDTWTANDPDGPDADFGAGPLLWRDAAGRKLVGAGNKAGDFYALDAATGALVWNVTAGISGERFLGAMASAFGRQFGTIVSEGRLVSLNGTTGRVAWVSTLSDRCFAGVAIANGIAFTGTIDGAIWAIHTGNGTILWRGSIPNATAAGVYGAPTVGEGMVLVPYEQWTYGWGPGGVAAFRPT